MTDTPELDAAWAEAPTRLIAAELGTREDDRVALVAAARLRELDAENRELDEQNAMLNLQFAQLPRDDDGRTILDAPAPVAAPAGDWPPVVTDEMLTKILRAYECGRRDYTTEKLPATTAALQEVLASLPRPAPAKDCTIPSPTPGQFLMDAADRRIAELTDEIAALKRDAPAGDLIRRDVVTDAMLNQYLRRVNGGHNSRWYDSRELPRIVEGLAAALDAAPPPPPMPVETPAALLDRLQAMIQATHPGATVAIVPVLAKVVRLEVSAEMFAAFQNNHGGISRALHEAIAAAPDARVTP